MEIEIDEAFQRFDTKNAVIDLQNVKILESVGLRVFVCMLQKAEKGSGRVILCNPTSVVADVLSLSKIATVDGPLAVVPDKEDAIAMLSSRAKGKNENL